MADAGTWLTPTLVAYEGLTRHAAEYGLSYESQEKLRAVAHKGADAIRLAAEAGVRIAFGTDLAGPLHHLQRDEFGLRAKVQDPIDVLRSATSGNAALMGQSSQLGCIAPDALADLIALEGDPRESLDVLAAKAPDPGFIMSRGRIVQA
jgi:imidazolonepropionase-like amidohydrolase